LSTTVTCLFHF